MIFDRLFGTFYLPDDQTLPECYGVSDFVPDGFWEQMIHPFITVKKRVSRGAMDTLRKAEILLAE